MTWKTQLKYFLARIWINLPPSVRQIGFSHSIPVLCYHSVNSRPDDHADPLKPELFDRHISYLTREWRPISMEDFSAALRGQCTLPPNSLLITFDDGYIDNYDVAVPILQKYQAKATFFISSGFIDREVDLIGRPEWRPMSWPQICEISQSALFTIGSHARSHTSLSKLGPSEAYAEVFASKERLEQQLGVPCRFFAYPNGQSRDISEKAVSAVKEAGFDLAFSTYWHTGNTIENRYRLNRVMIKGDDDLDTLKLKCRGAYDYIYMINHLRAALGL